MGGEITANEPDAVPSFNHLEIEADFLIFTAGFETGDLSEFNADVP